MGIKNSIRVKKTYKMKFSPAILVAVASAQDKKVPPRHPLQRLNRLVEFTEEIMTQWFSFLPSQQAWIKKFENNAIRMEKISIEETKDVVSMIRTNCHMVDQLMTENDVMLLMSTDTIVKIQLSVSNN